VRGNGIDSKPLRIYFDTWSNFLYSTYSTVVLQSAVGLY